MKSKLILGFFTYICAINCVAHIVERGEILCVDDSKYIEWQIHDLCLELENGNSVESREFTFLDASWRLHIVPHVKLNDDSWASVYLTREFSEISQHSIDVHIGIKRTYGPDYISHTFLHMFTRETSMYAIDKFVLMRDLTDDIWKINLWGEVTLFCRLRSSNAVCREVNTDTQRYKGEHKLAQDFRNLLSTSEEADIIFKVQGQYFKSHKAVLAARSPFFAAKFKHDFKHIRMIVIDWDPGAFKNFLEHLYTGKFEAISEDSIISLYRIADKYQIQDLKKNCVDLLVCTLSVEKFCEVAKFSLQHNESTLLKEAVSFFVKNVKKISVSVEWQTFLKQHPEQANEFNLKALEYHGIHE